ncbi:Abi family protein [Oscillibacter sp.]|uniref:Abi family protein n=1 Tax=Oscillibacter sp. TaxID=1945593 RepID=UPI0033972E37
MAALKLPKSYSDQIEMLKNRGLHFNDEAQAQVILSRVNYYRLVNAYSLGLYSRTCDPDAEPSYADGVSFFQIYDLYCFDTKLKQIVSSLIEPFELEFKTKLAYYLSLKYCSTCYLNPGIFESRSFYDNFIQELEREKRQQCRSPIIKHHDEKYGGVLPLWVAVEILSFGAVSKMFKNLNGADRREFSRINYNIPEAYLTSWLGCFVEARNICAHYGRLYNKNLVSRARMFANYSSINGYKIFSVIFLLYKLVPDTSLKVSLAVRLEAMLAQHRSVELNKIGFPENWSEILSVVGGIQDVNTENSP